MHMCNIEGEGELIQEESAGEQSDNVTFQRK